MSEHTREELYELQGLPLSAKIPMTKSRIRAWHKWFSGQVYISYSGGKDSTVLKHIVQEMYPDIPAVFFNTGVELPSVIKFVKQQDGVEIVKPKMTFVEIIKKYGYPMISKEVSEAVYGARRYLTSVIESMNDFDERTNEYYYRKVTGQGEYRKFSASPSVEADRGGIGNIDTNSSSRNFLDVADMESLKTGSRGVR